METKITNITEKSHPKVWAVLQPPTFVLADTRPEVHDGNEEATDRVLKDMALQDAIDEIDENS